MKKKVLIIHGFEGTPNGGWRPWLMEELAKDDIYACALAMPNPDNPVKDEWVNEIKRHVTSKDDIYLIGHSLGVPAIFHYLTLDEALNVKGSILVSGPCNPVDNEKIKDFLDKKFDFSKIKKKAGQVVVIHGDDDPLVDLSDAQKISRELDGELIIIKGGKHLNGSAGWNQLPQCLDALKKMFLNK